MKEEKTVKVKKSFTQKVDLQMCRQRQRRKRRKELICKSLQESLFRIGYE